MSYMMDGITLLNTITDSDPVVGGWFVLVMSIFGLFACLIALFLAINDRDFGFGCVAIIFLVAFAVFICLGVHDIQAGPQIQYQVLLDDTVPYAQFVERYEVVKQEGCIYTIIEKTGGS